MKNLEKLVKGYKKFLKRDDDTSRIHDLAVHGQSPKVMVIGCCDSRVNPDLIFNAAPGELFVVRNVANLVPPYEIDDAYHGTSAALEFAVTGLNIEHIVVMGHSACGGIKACCDGVRGAPVEGAFIPKWTAMVDDCARDVLTDDPSISDEAFTHAVEKEAMKISLSRLCEYPFIAERLDKGMLSVHGTYFDINEVQLYALDQDSGNFIAME